MRNSGSDDEDDDVASLEKVMYDLYSEYYKRELNATLELPGAEMLAQISMVTETGTQVWYGMVMFYLT